MNKLFNAYLDLMRIKRRVFSGFYSKSVLVMPPASPGSMGDEALVTGCVHYLKKNGIRKIDLIAYKPKDNWKHVGNVNRMVDLSNFLKKDSLRAMFKFARTLSNYSAFYCLGADVMDGTYSEFDSVQRIRLGELAYRTGAKSTILGFSSEKNPKKGVIQALKGLPKGVKVNIRDPVSYNMLLKQVGKQIDLSADVAFLMQPKKTQITQKVAKWAAKEKSSGRIVIGVNISSTVVHIIRSIKKGNAITIFAKILEGLYNKNKQVSFLLIPHDFRSLKGKLSDVDAANGIFGMLPEKVKEHSKAVQPPLSAAEIKEICGKLDFALSGRMHMSIACLGQGTPVVSIPYQRKFEGLLKHFKLKGMIIEPKDAVNPQKFIKLFLPLVTNRKNIRKKIKARLPHIMKLAKSNFK